MPSKIREAAMRLDLSSTLWRFLFTKDASELNDLLPAQLRELSKRFPEGSAEHTEIRDAIRLKETAHNE